MVLRESMEKVVSSTVSFRIELRWRQLIREARELEMSLSQLEILPHEKWNSLINFHKKLEIRYLSEFSELERADWDFLEQEFLFHLQNAKVRLNYLDPERQRKTAVIVQEKKLAHIKTKIESLREKILLVEEEALSEELERYETEWRHTLGRLHSLKKNPLEGEKTSLIKNRILSCT